MKYAPGRRKSLKIQHIFNIQVKHSLKAYPVVQLISKFVQLTNQNYFLMRDLIWLIIVILIIAWLIGYIGFGEAVGNLIHILLVLAIIGILYRLALGRRP